MERPDEVAAEFAGSQGNGAGPWGAADADGMSPPPSRAAGKSAPAGARSRSRRAEATAGDPLLRVKLSPPLTGTGLVARPRLLEALSEVPRHPLTLLSAPAGFGKTTLLSQWRQQTGFPVGWLSLAASDNDPARFWTCLIAALQTLGPGLREAALALLRAPQAPPVESSLAALASAVAALPRHCALVLDDYHLIEEQAIHSTIAFLVEHLPPSLHVVIGTRNDPPLPLARWRACGRLAELRADNLSFTPEETTTLLNGVMQLGLSAEHVAALSERTEGWAVGLQMAALSIRRCENVDDFVQAFAGDHRYVVDYLVEEVLCRQEERVQAFLLETAILERLSGGLCEAVAGLGEGEGQAMLERLERANLFTVALDGGREWYRYHHLFADCLKSRLSRSQPGRVRELHRRACDWYSDHGLTADAVGHALAAGEVELAARLIEQVALPLIHRGELATALAMLRAVPEDLLRGRPFLCVIDAHLQATLGRLDAAEGRLKDAERCLAATANGGPGARSAEEASGMQRVVSHILALRAAIAGGRRDVPLTITLARQALEHSFGTDEYLRAVILQNLAAAYRWVGDMARASETLAEAARSGGVPGQLFVDATTLVQLGSVQVGEGRLRQAAETYRQALQLGTDRDGRRSVAASIPCLGLARLSYEWNDLDAATRYAVQGIELGDQGGWTDILLFGHGVLARLKQARGDIDGALAALDRAEELACTSNSPQALARIADYRARVWLARGDLDAAVRWAERSGLGVDDEPLYLRESGHLTLVRVLIARGKAGESVRLLDRMLSSAESAGRIGSAVKIMALRALAQQALGNTPEALQTLARGVALAEPEGYVRSFVDAGAPLAALFAKLLEARQRGRLGHTSPAYLRTVLAAFHAGGGREIRDRREQPLAPDHLSEREREVLGLLVAGWWAPEIAQELVVSRNTVKSHIRSIYDKLGAHTRAEAIAQARERKLV